MNRFPSWSKEFLGMFDRHCATRRQRKVETVDCAGVDAWDSVRGFKQAGKFLLGLSAKLAEQDGLLSFFFGITEHSEQLEAHLVAAPGSRERPVEVDRGFTVFEATGQSRVCGVLRFIVDEDRQGRGPVVGQGNSDPSPDPLSSGAEFQSLADCRRVDIHGGEGLK